MPKFILGRKGPMTQMFTPEGVCVPVTLVEAGPCLVTAVRTSERDGYNAVQFAFEPAREKVLTKAEVGHCKKAGVGAMRHLREHRSETAPTLEVGAEVKCDTFAVGDLIDVVGVSKGRGFAGPIKRYGFKRQPAAHGGMATRRRGSSGSNTYPGRVFKGKRMAGHYGVERVTVKNLIVVAIDVESNVIAVRGAVPGHRGALVQVRSADASYVARHNRKG
jgi:large subunit ribosomal protein L3